MSNEPKQLHDYSSEIKLSVPAILSNTLVTPSLFSSSMDALLSWEKKTRLAADSWSTGYVCSNIIKLCGDLKKFNDLNDQLVLLSKRRSQLKNAILCAVQEAMKYLDHTPDKPTKLKLIDTLRLITSGKIYVELERSRLTRILSQIKEAEGDINNASEILQDIQIETIGSMESLEKTDFIIEQMRLCLDNSDYVRAEITAQKINKKLLNTVDYQDLKIRYYELQVRFYVHNKSYFDVCKCYRSIYETPKIQANNELYKNALMNAVIYLLLSPYDSEHSDILYRLKAEKTIGDLPSCKQALDIFTTSELANWPLPFEAEWKVHAVFTGEEGLNRWDVLRKRLVQHNIRILSKYYTRLNFARLAQLLSLSEKLTEEYVAEMVSSKQLYAKIDLSTKICVFAKPTKPNDVLNLWSNDVSKLLSLVEECTHLINKEEMLAANKA